MRQNNLKNKIRAGETAFGVFINYPSPELVEIAGLMGFDWVFIDAEHGPMAEETCEHMVRAAECVGITPIIRLPYPDPRLINRYLDTGAMGVLVCHLDSVERARAVVAAAKYHPLGTRGAGNRTRAADYGFRLSGTDYAAWANSETTVFGILEDAHVIDALPEILKVEGIDGFAVGPSDMSQSMGVPGQINHPSVVAAVDRISRMVLASDKALCRVVMNADTAVEEAQRFLDMGVPLIAHTLRGMLAHGAKDFLKVKMAASAQSHLRGSP